MQINRREFLILTAAFAAGCSSMENVGAPPVGRNRVINAGPVSNFAVDGVYTAFRTQGFFIIRQGGKLFALSSICTHRRCLVEAEADRSFLCPCHGSTFDANGQVTHGPARRDLPILETFINERGELLVKMSAG
jgi:Rieske Fe-S protein